MVMMKIWCCCCLWDGLRQMISGQPWTPQAHARVSSLSTHLFSTTFILYSIAVVLHTRGLARMPSLKYLQVMRQTTGIRQKQTGRPNQQQLLRPLIS